MTAGRDSRLWEALHAAVGSPVQSARAAAGGDINLAYCVTLADERRLFVKTHKRPPVGMYACEARGLAWLAEAPVPRIPQVVAFSDKRPAFLALEWIESASKAADHDEELGRGLAKLHATRPERFGFDEDNYVAVLQQDNRACDTWAEFYAERRLRPLLRRASDEGLASATLRASFEQLLSRMQRDPDGVCGPAEPPARLHGDLWAGNAITDERGEPCLVDPAVYAGHREIDLAMMRLFGGFSERCFSAYHEAFPLSSGHDGRIPLYQLYPLLVHVNLFGASYLAGVERALAAVS